MTTSRPPAGETSAHLPDEAESPAAPPQLHQTTSWLLAQLTSPPSRSRAYYIFLIFSMLVLIGLVDYITGILVSLQIFYLIPVALSVVWLGWRAGCATAVLAMFAHIVSDYAGGIFHHVPEIKYFWNRLISLSVSVVLVWGLHALTSLYRQLEERVRQRTTALEKSLAARDQLQNQLFEVSRRERSSIGHDLHDGLGQHLTATAIAANLLAARLATQGSPAAEDAHAIEKLIQESIGKTRQIARGLLLTAIESGELVPELEELAANISEEQHVPCHFTKHGDCHGLDETIASHLFYIAQEATRNAVRHARPTRLEISLDQVNSDLVLTVTNNGSGLPPLDSCHPGMGLRIMAHRAELIGGELSIKPAPGGGTCMRCRVPLPNPPLASRSP